MKKLTRFFAFFITCLLLFMALLPLALNGRFSKIAEYKANELLDAKVSFGKVRISFFRDFPDVSVKIPDLIIAGKDSFANDTLIKADIIRVTVNLKSILNSQGVTVKKILLKNTSVYAKVLEDGSANWNIMKQDTSLNNIEDTTSVRLLLSEINIENADIVYDDKKMGLFVSLKDWNGFLEGDLGSDRTVIKTNSSGNDLNVLYGKIPLLSGAVIVADMALDADFKNDKYILQTNNIKLNEIDISLDGYFAFPDTSVTRFDLNFGTGKSGLKQLLSLIPAVYKNDFSSLLTKGDFIFSGFVKGDMVGDLYPAFKFDISVSDGYFKYPALKGDVKNIDIKAGVVSAGGSLDNVVAEIKSLNLVFAGSPFGMNVIVKNPLSDIEWDGTAKGRLDLSRVSDVVKLGKDVALAGIIDIDADMAGKMSYVEKSQYDKIKASGNILVDGFLYKVAGEKDIIVKSASLSLRPEKIVLGGFDVKYGENDLNAKGEVGNYMLWLLKDKMLTGNLNLYSNNLNLNDFMSQDTSKAVKDTTKMLAFAVPSNVDFKLKANAGKVLFDNLDLRNVKAEMTVKDSRVNFSDLSAEALGGGIALNGYYDTKNVDSPEIAMGLSLSKVAYNKAFTAFDFVKALAPVFEKAKGDLNLKMNIKTGLDKFLNPNLSLMSADGLFQSANVSISGIKVLDLLSTSLKNDALKNINAKDVKVSFKISDGRIKTSPFDIKLGSSVLNLDGSSGIDKTLDYNFRFSNTQQKIMNIPLKLEGKISGTFTDPKISFNAKEFATTALTGLKDEFLKSETGKKTTEQINKTREDVVKKAEEIRLNAKLAGEKLIKQAEAEGNKLIEKAGNPILKAAARATADKLVAEARKKAAEFEKKAEDEIRALELESEKLTQKK